jgi:hypothetical protein
MGLLKLRGLYWLLRNDSRYQTGDTTRNGRPQRATTRLRQQMTHCMCRATALTLPETHPPPDNLDAILNAHDASVALTNKLAQLLEWLCCTYLVVYSLSECRQRLTWPDVCQAWSLQALRGASHCIQFYLLQCSWPQLFFAEEEQAFEHTKHTVCVTPFRSPGQQ